MADKSSAVLRNDYRKNSLPTHEAEEQLMALKQQLAVSEKSLSKGEQTISIADARAYLEEKYSADV